MEDISINYEGTGGGHAGAAGIDVIADMETVLFECVESVKEVLRNSPNPSGSQ